MEQIGLRSSGEAITSLWGFLCTGCHKPRDFFHWNCNIEDNFIVKAKRDIQFIDGHKMINEIDGKRNIISYFQYNLHLPDVAISLTVTVIAQFQELFVFET